MDTLLPLPEPHGSTLLSCGNTCVASWEPCIISRYLREDSSILDKNPLDCSASWYKLGEAASRPLIIVSMRGDMSVILISLNLGVFKNVAVGSQYRKFLGVGIALVPSLVECNFQAPVRKWEVLVMVKLMSNREGFWKPGSWAHLINKGFNPLLWTFYANLGMKKANNCEKNRRASKSFCYSLFCSIIIENSVLFSQNQDFVATPINLKRSCSSWTQVQVWNTKQRSSVETDSGPRTVADQLLPTPTPLENLGLAMHFPKSHPWSIKLEELNHIFQIQL